MSTYVLIHGGCHGAWCWDKVTPLLKQGGHTVVAPDLPGRGKDSTPMVQVTLQSCADRVCEVISQQSEPVILAGHSMGGRVISQAAEQCPNYVSILVYVTASLLRNGEVKTPPIEGVGTTLHSQSLITFEDGLLVTHGEEALKELLYHDCTDEDVEWAKSMLVPEALAILQTPIRVTEKNYGRIPRVYIECLQDNAILPETQKQMYTRMPCQRVISMNTSHMPMLSAPLELAGHLMSIP